MAALKDRGHFGLSITLVMLVIFLGFGPSNDTMVGIRTADAAGGKAMAQVLMQTSKGDFVIEMNTEKAPITVKNFLEYVDAGFFDGTIFHRVIPGFMVQGGGMLPDMSEKTTRDPIANEAENGLKNLRGTLSMARTNEVNSATSQFFINVADNAFLDNSPGNFGYAVFGKIVEGMDVVDEIVSMKTGSYQFHRDVPVDPIHIKKAVRQ